ncbi:MAG: glycosyltransferase family 4 protein [Verrucomicrobia bacterium]|nr:glycosyltransferase family 4 protein [Verrucomicrobiota bacterium]
MSTAEHIAFICPRFAEGGTVGGAETLLRAQADHAAQAGRKVSFLTTCAKNHFTWENELPAGTRKIDDLDVTFFPVDQDRDIEAFLKTQNAISRGWSYSRDDEQVWLKNSVNSRALIEHLKEKGDQYDRIILGPYLFGLVYFAAMLDPQRTVLVPCLHDEAFAYTQSIAEMFCAAGTLMFNTRAEQDLACRLYEIAPEKCHVVGMGLDSFPSNPTATARAHGIETPYILYSGRREPLKGTPLLIEYFATFRERTAKGLHLVFTGSGPIDLSSQVEPFVTDLGFVTEQEKRDAMAGAACFCQPSVNESLSIVILEAWLAGTPCLVHARSDVMREQCRRSNGGLWFANYPEFEEALLLMLDNSKIRDALAQSGRHFVEEEYAWSTVEKRMLSALDAAPPTPHAAVS